ncbi:MAG: aminotransferase class V-fold PLP-dependent enzyme [Bacteroidetes bacterium]|nr:aminotransferase class V-fold PLP-dependent enzyme [Bacteroidota bacterium]MBT5527826.1 aminotransferase class V-fold PLP-dependent enzyme [Cytophagia bacterium]MBT3422235.1 aminotransferase class V-fold PLP-dependent enzyme [Bacteroidota bacterium]MBT3933000.1 aminotransferase class V-fold PLP-dependent enzyme [Bacteroidota bacterium]MBT4339268.1 aminotransferase class V-fold PLP-dependent enzyme [Bacteroidota bacterium]
MSDKVVKSEFEKYFKKYRKNIIGYDKKIETPFGMKKLIYADWTASGRLYAPIEKKMCEDFGPYVANTHTETTHTGTLMTLAYNKAKAIIKEHVHAGPDEVILTSGSGMTRIVSKFQRMLGLKIPDQFMKYTNIPDDERPVVFVTHMEHHSNHTSWQETIADVEVIPPDDKGDVCMKSFKELLEKYKRRNKIYAAVTACSNVTGIQPCVREIAKLVHEYGGYCFVDYACSAPYVEIKMNTDDPKEKFDAIYFSPHKYLGGPGSAGVLVFNRALYSSRIPDTPGGGTVTWTDSWGDRFYFDDIEMREDGGTPAFLQTIRTALAVQLKDEMGVEKMMKREEEILEKVFEDFDQINGLHILAAEQKNRLGVFSFYIEDLHYNLGVKLLNDRYGIQTRGGCACAGTYGHYLFEMSKELSDQIQYRILHGDLSAKPGWIRMSIHPTMTNKEVNYICSAIREVAENHKEWSNDYEHDISTNEFSFIGYHRKEDEMVEEWFRK